MNLLKNKVAGALLLSLSAMTFSHSAIATQQFGNSTASDRTPKDPGVINEERIVYWLKKRGELKQNASEKEINKALADYTSRAFTNDFDNEFSKLSQNNLIKTKKAAPKTVKVLTILIDFPDLPYNNNRLTSADTGMFYSDYNVDHYRQTMFSTNGYTGPSGQTLMSAYQYFQRESGNEFFFTGEVFGWVTAENNADFYGANDADNDDNDQDAESLIQEAITKAVAANNIDLNDYDLEDPYDIDQDGVFNEPDGIIDHVNIFHSSIGEEAGGGVLNDNAIWSHRFAIGRTTGGYLIPGTTKRAYNYTIQPIDAAAGVIVHEFGHDLGLSDEYDTAGSRVGAPTGFWSAMASGSYGGIPAGTKPTGFSSLAREILQTVHGANWINQTTVDLDDLRAAPQTIDLVEAINHASGINQVKITIPDPLIPFGAPFAGTYQYYSNEGDNLQNEMSFELVVPNANSVILSMKARWEIEQDYDYVQLSVDGQAIKGNVTADSNPLAHLSTVTNYITGNSIDLASAQGALGWIDLTYDLAAFVGQTVSIKIAYITDEHAGGFGFAVDDFALDVDGVNSVLDDAEQVNSTVFKGFERISDTRVGQPQNYLVQLRSHNQVDEGLAQPSIGYDRGVVIWFANQNYSNNKVVEHPGYGFVGVVDADQNLIGTSNSSVQMRDAAFSLYNQTNFNGDNNLSPNSTFNDTDDYSSPDKLASGLVLPVHGLSIELLSQAADSSTATIQLSINAVAISAGFNSAISERTVAFTNTSSAASQNLTYSWDFGDGSAATGSTPSYTYTADGTFTVTLTVTDDTQASSSISKTVTISTAPNAGFSIVLDGSTAAFTDSSNGGIGGLTYAWDFGDGNSSTSQSPSNIYAADGTYSVVLTISDSENRTNTLTKNVTIQTAPTTGGGNTGGESSGGGGPLGWLTLILGGLVLVRRKN